MKTRLRLLILSTLLHFSFTTSADIIRFHSGYIYAAELSTINKDLQKTGILIPNNEQSKFYKSFNEYSEERKIEGSEKTLAIIYSKLDKGMSITPYDFTLKGPKGEYRCISVAPNDAAFKPISYSKVSNLVISSSDTVYVRMLFIVPTTNNDRSTKTVIPFKLSYKLSKPSIDQSINFHNRKDTAFPLWDDLIGGTYILDSNK